MGIKILSSNLINKIAAGEVVERPASALKELIENAVDAGATKIDVVIRDGGRALIEVTDNGAGIERGELPLAITRHATSKLDDEDLMNINFLGFRGEALPSIGAVSRMKITSRTADADSAWQIRVIGGNVFDAVPVSGIKGTRVEVEDLFFSTPARLKFLKTVSTEAAYCEEVVEKTALAHPGITFTFSTDKRQGLKCAASGIERRIEDVLGKDFMDNAVKIEAGNDTVSLDGYVGIPTYNKANSRYQYFFVNGRPVKDKFLAGAVKSAFFSLMAPDRFPAGVLFLKVHPDAVDVNVHPQKSEVRFRDGGMIRGMVISAIQNALRGGAANRTVSLMSVLPAKEPSRPPHGGNSFSEAELKVPFYDNSLAEKKESGYVLAETERQFDYSPEKDDSSQSYMITPSSSVDNVEDREGFFGGEYPLGTARIQIKNTYIIAENADGMVIVDQHAAHERITYEKLNAEYVAGKVVTQMLLIPEVVELKSEEYDAVMKIKDDIARLGLVAESFGAKAVIVREVPALLGSIDIKKLVQDLAITALEYKGDDFLKDKIKDVVATMSCHGSIRAGRVMNVAEMNEMLRQIENGENSGQCIHGRPTYIKLPLNMIEKLFLRK